MVSGSTIVYGVFPLFPHMRFHYFQDSCSLFPLCAMLTPITAFSAQAGNAPFPFIRIVPIVHAAEALNSIDFPVPLQYDLDSYRCLPIVLFLYLFHANIL